MAIGEVWITVCQCSFSFEGYMAPFDTVFSQITQNGSGSL